MSLQIDLDPEGGLAVNQLTKLLPELQTLLKTIKD